MSIWKNGTPGIVVAHSSFDIKSLVAAWPEKADCIWVRNRSELVERLPEAEILVTMYLWEARYLDLAPDLKLVQTMTSGVDLYDLDDFRRHGVRLASARGANANAVAEHALALLLSLARRLPEARDDQRDAFWRKLGATPGERRRELAGSHVAIVGFGTIGKRLATLCLALGLKVTVVRRDTTSDPGLPVQVVSDASLAEIAAGVDHIVLACPATPETTGLIDRRVLARMKPEATLINVSRGAVVVEADLIAALSSGRIAGAALDTFETEPLPATSPLWGMKNVVITPHVAGDTTAYEGRIADILRENIARLEKGESLVNQIV